MKKALIGMAVGAVALGASVVPAAASGETIWEGIEGDDCGAPIPIDTDLELLEQLVLIGGWGERLDTTGNGKPYYTVFGPVDEAIDGVLDALGTSIADLSSTPAVVAAILADHIANGSFEEDELSNPNLTRITMRSGYVATWDSTDFEIDGQPVIDSYLYENGALHCIAGFIDSTPQVPTEGLNSLDTPKDGTPGGTNSLPNTL